MLYRFYIYLINRLIDVYFQQQKSYKMHLFVVLTILYYSIKFRKKNN